MSSPDNFTLLQADRLLDGSGGAALESAAVLLADGKVAVLVGDESVRLLSKLSGSD